MKYKNIDGELLRELYEDKNHTLRELADRFDCSISTISSALAYNYIDKRGYGEHNNAVRHKIDKDKLQKMYWKDEMSISEIANCLGYGKTTIYYCMLHHEIDIRCSGPNKGTGIRDNVGDEFIKEQYVDKHKTLEEVGEVVADKMDRDKPFSRERIRQVLEEMGVERRTIADYDMSWPVEERKFYKLGPKIKFLAEEQHKCVYKIAAILNVTQRTVGDAIKYFNIDVDPVYSYDTVLNKEERNELVQDYKNEMAYDDMAEKYGIAKPTVADYLDFVGAKKIGIRALDEDEIDAVADDYENTDMSVVKIAEKYDTSTKTVYKAVRVKGVDRRRADGRLLES